MSSLTNKDAIRRHWEQDPCGSKHASAPPGTAEFYAQVEAERYRLEPFIPAFARFDETQAKDVLEIGVGVGTDFVNFARNGAHLTGVDLTEASIELVRARLALEGLSADVRTADAESLPFDDASFDVVYSWGVLHHTPETAQAVAEVNRVLRPGGEARVMLYARHSWVAFALWARYALLAGRPLRPLGWAVANHMESPGTKAYTTPELRRLFSGFTDVRLQRWVTPYDRRVAGPLARAIGPRLGWFAGVTAVRPA